MEAILYALNQETYLKRYLNDDHLSINNLVAECVLKNFATGRRNWLFVKIIWSTQASATVYSTTEAAMLNGLKPCHYLTYVMERLKDLSPFPKKETLINLLPWSDSLLTDCYSKLKKQETTFPVQVLGNFLILSRYRWLPIYIPTITRFSLILQW